MFSDEATCYHSTMVCTVNVFYFKLAAGGNPVPDCGGGRFPCLCPDGYYFQYPDNTCERKTDDDTGSDFYGGHEDHSFDGGYSQGGHQYPGYEDTGSILRLPHYPNYGGGLDEGIDGKLQHSFPHAVGKNYNFCFLTRTLLIEFKQYSSNSNSSNANRRL